MKIADCKLLKKQIEEQYKQAIELAEKQRLDGLAAIDTVWNMLHAPRRKQEPLQQNEPAVNGSGVLSKTSLPTSKQPYGALIDTVKKSLSIVPDTFTSKHVIMAMQQISSNIFNHSSVSNRLKRLAKDGIIELVKTGHGKSPNVYCLKKTQNNTTTVNAGNTG